MVNLINKKTKQEITVTEQEWKAIQENEVLQNAFKEVKKPAKPAEVAKLEAKKAEEKK